jgi:cardiolipin synthase
MLVMSTSTNLSGLNLPAVVSASRRNPLRMAPNLLTLLRIVLVPFLILAVVERRFELAFALFLVAAVTDGIDGLLARWLSQRTMLGQYLDPVADKLLLSSLFVVLTWMGILEPRVAILVFSRDIGMLITAVVLYSTANLRDFHPSLLGKANSFSQVGAIGTVLLERIYARPWVQDARVAMLDATIFLTVASGFHYGWVASRRVAQLPDTDREATAEK